MNLFFSFNCSSDMLQLLVSDLNSIQKPLNFLWFSAFIMSGDPFMRAFLYDSSLLISVFSPI